MQVGDLIYLNRCHSTNCGKDYPVNSIGILVVTAVPDRDDDLRVRFSRHSTNDRSYIPASKIVLVPTERQEEARTKFDKAKEEYKNAVL